jgi:hypothetical protein
MAKFTKAVVYYCDTPVNAQAAVSFLMKPENGYMADQITVDEITGVGEYDGGRFGGGGKLDTPPKANFLVVARA